jgi:hypothetical protein
MNIPDNRNKKGKRRKMSDKAHVQKAYEKVQMLRNTPCKENIRVMVAADSTGKQNLILMMGGVPIATILREPNDLVPDFAQSLEIEKVFDRAREVDSRVEPDSFSEESSDELAVRRIFDDAGYEAISLLPFPLI